MTSRTGKRPPKAAKATKQSQQGTKKGQEEVEEVEEVDEVERENKEPKHASKGAKATSESLKGKNYSHCIFHTKCWSDCHGCYLISLEQVISSNNHDSHSNIFCLKLIQ